MSSTDYVCNHVKVFIRVRPENAREKNGKHRKVVHVVDKHMLIFDPKEEEIGFFYRSKVQRRYLSNKNKDLQFIFDRVFDANSSQWDIFEETKSILESVFNGYNCTVFAYGATGSGKTHTMLGSSEKPGVMYLTMKEMYDRMERLKNEKSCDVAVSYLEVYNEEVRDLLANSRSLAVREDAQNGVVIQGLTLHKPSSSKQLLQMLDYGNKNRTQHPTDANSNSSRSHAVFQIYLRQQDRTANINQNIKIAKMCLVDLAGSERISSMNMKAARFREGANINRSLLALGNVINALTDSKKKIQHIPYRNSKLTRLLKDSLGGNCQTIMIAAISPSSVSFEDTYNTLKYANRAKDIKSSIKSNVLNLNYHVGKYAQICEDQRQEIMELKDKLKAYERENILLGINPKESEIKRFEEVLEDIFLKRQKVRISCLDLELKMKEAELLTFYYKQCQQHARLFPCEPATERASCKYERKLAALKTQHYHILQKIKTMEKMLEENSNWLHRVENEICLLGQDGKTPQVLKQELQRCRLKMEVMDLKHQIQHMAQLFCLQKPVNSRTEKLTNILLPAFHQQYQTLKRAGLVTATAQDTFAEVEQLLKDENGKVWEDQITELPEQISDRLNIASIMNFSQLAYCQATPCNSTKSGSAHKATTEVKKNTSPDPLKPSIESKENPPSMKKEGRTLTCKTSRRRLEQSLTCSSLVDLTTSAPCSAQQDDLLIKEGFASISYTPEACRDTDHVPCQLPGTGVLFHKAGCHVEALEKDLSDVENSVPGKDENVTSVAYDSEESRQSALGARTQHPFPSETDTVSDHIPSRKQSTRHKSFLQRLGLPSLLSTSETNSKPSYMSLTSAARRKRKSTGFPGQSDGNLGLPGTKRLRQDVPPAAIHQPTRQGQSHNYLARSSHVNDGDLIYKGLTNNVAKRRRLRSRQYN